MKTAFTILILASSVQAFVPTPIPVQENRQSLYRVISSQTHNARLAGGQYCDVLTVGQSYCFNWPAQEFTFLGQTQLDSVELFINGINHFDHLGLGYTEDESLLRLSIYQDLAGTAPNPENKIFEQVFTTYPDSLEIKHLDLGLDLDPGSYWFSVEIPEESKFYGTMPYAEAYPWPTRSYFDGTEWRKSGTHSSLYMEMFGTTDLTGTGDVDKNGRLDHFDLEFLTGAIQELGPAQGGDSLWDINQDSMIDIDDWHAMIEKMGLKPGDANMDGRFTSLDITMAMTHGHYNERYFRGNVSWHSGDWNGDLVFDSSDLVDALANNFYEQPSPAMAAVSVPEPTGATLLLWGLVIFLALTKAGRGLLLLPLKLVVFGLAIIGWIIAFDGFKNQS